MNVKRGYWQYTGIWKEMWGMCSLRGAIEISIDNKGHINEMWRNTVVLLTITNPKLTLTLTNNPNLKSKTL